MLTHSIPLPRFYSIFDGHEGEAAAQHVAEQLPQAVAAQLTQARRADCGCGRSGTEACNDEVAIEAALQRAVAETNAAFLRRAKEESLDDGSTAVFALLCGRRFLVGSIGDSSAVLCSRDAGDGTTAAEAAELQQAPASGGCGPTAAATASNKPTGKREQRAEVLSAVHSPAREDERRRIESAGGFVKTTAGLCSPSAGCKQRELPVANRWYLPLQTGGRGCRGSSCFRALLVTCPIAKSGSPQSRNSVPGTQSRQVG